MHRTSATISTAVLFVTYSVRTFVYSCVCVCEREREIDGLSVHVCRILSIYN